MPSGFGYQVQEFFRRLFSDVPRDLIVLLVVLFSTFSLYSLAPGLVQLFWLSPAAWSQLWLWQLVTYVFVGLSPPSLWFLVELLFLLLFGKQAYYNLGRALFWRLILGVGVVAGAVAVAINAAGHLLAGTVAMSWMPFPLMAGHHLLMLLFITVYAVVNRHATIYFMLVLPVQARWIVPLEILISFIAFLQTKDFAGFCGLMAAIGITWGWLQPTGFHSLWRTPWLRLQTMWLQWKINRIRAGRDDGRAGDDDFRGRGGSGDDRWIN